MQPLDAIGPVGTRPALPAVGSGPVAAGGAEPGPAGLPFGAWLARALDQVDAVQAVAAEGAVQMASGRAADLAQVMIASEQATIALQLTVAVRNKVLEAYQEIMRMPL